LSAPEDSIFDIRFSTSFEIPAGEVSFSINLTVAAASGGADDEQLIVLFPHLFQQFHERSV
jgi:hypothetical protein